jgi:DNA-binding MarR family transcriptional regulator
MAKPAGSNSANSPAQHDATRRALEHLDPLLQHRSRLGALVLLSTVDELSFSRLRTLLDETDGNLGAQLRKLEEAEYLVAQKEFVDRKPVTWYSLTPRGQRALKSHLQAMESLMRDAQV